jgi:hypothetical protein
MSIGIFYRHQRPTMDAQVAAMQEAAGEGSVAEFLDAFAVRQERAGAR